MKNNFDHKHEFFILNSILELTSNAKYISFNVLHSKKTRYKFPMNVFHCYYHLQKIIWFKTVIFRRMNWFWQFYYNVVPIMYAQRKNLYLVSKQFFAYSNLEKMSRFAWYADVKMQNPNTWWRYQNHFTFQMTHLFN